MNAAVWPADVTRLGARLSSIEAAARHCVLREASGRLLSANGTIISAQIPGAMIGEICELRDHSDGRSGLAEVVGFNAETTLLAPYGSTRGLSLRTEVIRQGRVASIDAGPHLIGAVINGLGTVVEPPAGESAFPGLEPRTMPLFADPPEPMSRKPIDRPLCLGVRAIDGFMTCGEGQRMGIFGNAGMGKSTLLSQIVKGTDADIIVVSLVGERGREVGEFLTNTLGPAMRHKSIIVAATADRPPAERMKAVLVGTALAEYFRDEGLRVLLLIDSITRLARAFREIGLAAGEPPTRRGYPPSVFAGLPQVFERAGQGRKGSITALYTVLVEGDISMDPVAEETISLLDGHIVLSERLAGAGHYPAIEVLESKSRVMTHIVPKEHVAAANAVRAMMARYREVELLIRVGEYKKGNDKDADIAIEMKSEIDAFLKQGEAPESDFGATVQRLRRLARL